MIFKTIIDSLLSKNTINFSEILVFYHQEFETLLELDIQKYLSGTLYSFVYQQHLLQFLGEI